MTISVEVSNLGPLRSAGVEVADLTLLVGENNTGKTFFATLVHRVLSSAPLSWPRSFRPVRHLSTEIPIQIQDWVDHHVNAEGDTPPPNDPWLEPTHDTLEWAVMFTTSLLKSFGTDIREGIGYALGVKTPEIRRRTRDREIDDCYLRVRNTQPDWEVELRFDSDRILVQPPDPKSWLEEALNQEGVCEDLEFSPWEVHKNWARSLYRGWPRYAVHLPAGRTGMVEIAQVLASVVIRGSSVMGIRPIDIEPLPGISADLLSLLLETQTGFLSSNNGDPDIGLLIRKFEESIGGAIRFSDPRTEGASGILVHMPEGVFPLSHASAMFSDLAPLLLILEGYIKRGDVVVIDEPEAHLHPMIQREIALLFVELVNYGVRIVLTTHSDYLVGELNNLIRAGVLNTAQRPLPMGRSLELMISNVRALQFLRDDQGCVAGPLELSSIDGIDETTFTSIMESLYDESARLINDLIEQSSPDED